MQKQWEGQSWLMRKRNRRKRLLRFSRLRNCAPVRKNRSPGPCWRWISGIRPTTIRKRQHFCNPFPMTTPAPALAREYLHQAEEISVSGYQTAYEQAVACKEHACKADDFYQAANAFRKIEDIRMHPNWRMSVRTLRSALPPETPRTGHCTARPGAAGDGCNRRPDLLWKI